MKNALVIVTLSALLTACATGSRQPMDGVQIASSDDVAGSAPTGAVESAAQRRVKVKSSRSQSEEDSLPSVELTEDLMFKYLAAELADQRGNWQAAYMSMMTIAQQTRDPRIAKRAAEIALRAKQPAAALTAARLWREIAPASDEASQVFLSLLMLDDNIAAAKPVLQQRLKETRPPLLGPTILQIQRMLARNKDKNAAYALLEELVEPYKALPESHIALAQSAFLRGDSALAVSEARSALKIAPGSELAALTLAQVIPDKDEATKSLKDFITANPKSREVRLSYARLLVDQKKYEEARNEFKVLLKQQPKDPTVLYALGLLGAQNNDYKEAESYLIAFIDALDAEPDEDRDPTQALLLLAQIAEERNDTQAALKWLDKIDDSSSQAFMGAQIRRAQLIARSGDLEGARRLLHGLNVEGEGEEVQLLVSEAQLLRTADQASAAFTLLENGLKKYPDNTDLLYDYAMAAEKLDKLTAMETSLRKIIKIAPANQHAYNALGYSFAERNVRLEEAHKLVEKALQLAPQDPFIMDSMGWVQFRLGRLNEAETYLRRAYEIRPDPEIAVHLGEVLWVKGQREDAKKLWRDANVKDPKNDTLKSTLARLQVKL